MTEHAVTSVSPGVLPGRALARPAAQPMITPTVLELTAVLLGVLLWRFDFTRTSDGRLHLSLVGADRRVYRLEAGGKLAEIDDPAVVREFVRHLRLGSALTGPCACDGDEPAFYRGARCMARLPIHYGVAIGQVLLTPATQTYLGRWIAERKADLDRHHPPKSPGGFGARGGRSGPSQCARSRTTVMPAAGASAGRFEVARGFACAERSKRVRVTGD